MNKQEAIETMTAILLNEVSNAFNKTLETSTELADVKVIWDIFNGPNKGSLIVRQMNLLMDTIDSFDMCYGFIRHVIEENPEQYISAMMKLGLTPPQYINLLIEKLAGHLIMGEKRILRLRPVYVSASETLEELGVFEKGNTKYGLEMIDRLDGNPMSARDSIQMFEALSEGKDYYSEYLKEKR